MLGHVAFDHYSLGGTFFSCYVINPKYVCYYIKVEISNTLKYLLLRLFNILICLPIKSTDFSCFAIISTKNNVLVLSTLGTRIVLYSKTRSSGYSNSDTILFQCIHFPSSDTKYSKIVSSFYTRTRHLQNTDIKKNMSHYAFTSYVK